MSHIFSKFQYNLESVQVKLVIKMMMLVMEIEWHFLRGGGGWGEDVKT